MNISQMQDVILTSADVAAHMKWFMEWHTLTFWLAKDIYNIIIYPALAVCSTNVVLKNNVFECDSLPESYLQKSALLLVQWYILFSPFMSQSLWFGWKHLSLRSFMSISFCTRSSILAYTGTLWTHYSHTYKATPDIQAHSVAILKNPEAVSCLKKLSLMKLKPMLSKSFFWWYGVFKSL